MKRSTIAIIVIVLILVAVGIAFMGGKKTGPETPSPTQPPANNANQPPATTDTTTEDANSVASAGDAISTSDLSGSDLDSLG
jgi:hypothetical protein